MPKPTERIELTAMTRGLSNATSTSLKREITKALERELKKGVIALSPTTFAKGRALVKKVPRRRGARARA